MPMSSCGECIALDPIRSVEAVNEFLESVVKGITTVNAMEGGLYCDRMRSLL